MKTYYDVLNLHKTCSSKEIKDSFIKLSKLYHPDKNKSSDAHKKFVEVNEAYSVLGKPDTRSQYDSSLIFGRTSGSFTSGPSPSTVTRTPYEQYAQFYANNMRQTPTTGYITNKKIKAFFVCCLLVIIGSGIQMKALLNRNRRRNQELALYLKESRERKRKMREENLKEREAALVENSDVGN